MSLIELIKKKKWISFGLSLSLTIIIILICIFTTGKSKEIYKNYYQDLDYSENIKKILNPDQGFYSAACVQVGKDTIADRTYIINNNFQLYHLRMDISAFSKVVNGVEDIPLTQKALENIDQMLSVYQKKKKNVIIRFAYDKNFEGKKDQEPSVNMMIQHITQLSPILTKYNIVLTAIEVGMVGPWGEMHSSKIATAETINLLMKAFIEKTSNIPILVRTPKMIYNYLNITIKDIDSTIIKPGAPEYKLGLFNDGYLGSSSDLGTYSNRTKEIPWLAHQTNHLPFGGEVTMPDSTLHDIDKCLPEMHQIHLSYLNNDWNDQVVQVKWKKSNYTESCGNNTIYYNQSAFTYIQNHLGYRFVLEKSIFTYSSSYSLINITLTLKNVGFGNLNRKKNVSLYFVDTKNTSYFKPTVGVFSGENEMNLSSNLDFPNGSYSVYLSLNTLIDNVPYYPIQFSNNLWNSELSSNLIGFFYLNKTK